MQFITVLLSILCVACSPVMAAKQDRYIDVNRVKPGVQKAVVLSTFGAPVQSAKEGENCEVYRFKQGYRGATRTGRAVFHTAADVMTLGLWEIIGTPVEAAFSGEDLSYEVCYDGDNKVQTVTQIKESR